MPDISPDETEKLTCLAREIIDLNFMIITICGSIDFTYEIKKIADELAAAGHKVNIPFTSQKILNGQLSLADFQKEKEKNRDGAFRKIKEDVIKRYYKIINESDAILVVNITKREIKNYIGGNVLLEMGFAHVLDKKIYLLNDVPELAYTDEISAMKPVVISGDLSSINNKYNIYARH